MGVMIITGRATQYPKRCLVQLSLKQNYTEGFEGFGRESKNRALGLSHKPFCSPIPSFPIFLKTYIKKFR